jgi:hypothetical protein
MPDVDHLYALPLEDFIPARAAAAKELRKAGDRETAAVVAKLPKPTPPAWTANQVAREQPELIEAMLDAGEALRDAQEAAVSGGGGGGLRDATLAERRAVDAVMTAATAYRPAGKPLSRAMADRLRTTLHAAAGDAAIREALAHGRLVDEAQAGGAWPFALEPAPREERGAAKRRATKAKPASTDDEGAKAGDESAGGAAKTAAGGKAGDGAAKAAAGGKSASGAAKPAARGKASGGKGSGGAAKARAADKAAENAAARKAERERAEADARAQAERDALEAELRDARGSLRVRERVFASAQEDAEETKDAVTHARAALEQAQKAAADAVADAEAAQQVLEEARKALDHARDTVARLEERLD